MIEPKTQCTACGVTILSTTAERFSGRCMPCANGTRAQIDAARKRASDTDRSGRVIPIIASDVEAINAALDSLGDPESEVELATLQGALDALSGVPDRHRCIASMFRVFERFPWDDGFETFWGILHALESLPGYETYLLSSVRRVPGAFSLLMVNRLLNSGVQCIDGVSLLSVLQEIGSDASVSDRARVEAQRFVDWQASARPG